MSQEIEIKKAELTDLKDILDLQKKAYQQEAEIYNDFSIPPLTQDIDSLKSEWQRGIVIKAESNGQIIGSVRAELVENICRMNFSPSVFSITLLEIIIEEFLDEPMKPLRVVIFRRSPCKTSSIKWKSRCVYYDYVSHGCIISKFASYTI